MPAIPNDWQPVAQSPQQNNPLLAPGLNPNGLKAPQRGAAAPPAISDWEPVQPQTRPGTAQAIPTTTIRPQAKPAAPAAQPQPQPQMSALERFGTGLKDPIEGGAQLLPHLLPDAIVKPINQFNNWLADKTGLVEKLPPGGMDEEAAQREKTIQAETPKGTDWWRIAGNVASPANLASPGGVFGDASLGRRIGSAMVQGAGIGALAPSDTKDGFWTDKTAQTITGSVVGGAAGAAHEAVMPVVRWATGLHGADAVNDKAVRQVLARVQSDQKGGGASFQDMLDIANATPDKPMAFADVADANAKGLLGKIARAPGDAKTHIAKFFKDRDLDTATRVTGDLADNFGHGAAYYADQSLREARRVASGPLYAKAFETNMPLDSTYLNDIRATNPLVQEGLRRGWQIEQNEAQGEFDAATGTHRPINWADYGIKSVTTDPQTGQTTIELGQVPNLRLWNVMKKGLDAKIEELESANNGEPTQLSVSIDKLRRGILRELDRLSPDYKVARDAWAGPTMSRAALRDGQKFLSMQPEAIEDRFRTMSAGEKEFFKLGAANSIRKIMLTTGERGDEVRRLMLPFTRMQLRAMFDTDAEFDRYFASLNAEHLMWQTWAATYGGSNSADKLAEDLRPDANAASHGVRAAQAVAESRWLPAIGHGLQAVGRYLRPEDPRLSMAKAKLYTAPPAETIERLKGATKDMPTYHIHSHLAPAATMGLINQDQDKDQK